MYSWNEGKLLCQFIIYMSVNTVLRQSNLSLFRFNLTCYMSWWRWMVSDSNTFVFIRSEGRWSVRKQLVLCTASTYQLLLKAPSWLHWNWLLKWWGFTATTRSSVIVEMQICKSQALMRLPVSHIVVYQGCAGFISEGPNAIKKMRPRAVPSFYTGCLALVTGIKIHFVVMHLARGPNFEQMRCMRLLICWMCNKIGLSWYK